MHRVCTLFCAINAFQMEVSNGLFVFYTPNLITIIKTPVHLLVSLFLIVAVTRIQHTFHCSVIYIGSY